MATDTKGCYEELADYYHLIFENWEASMARQAAMLGTLLERECGTVGAIRILDCACGIGTQILGLTKLGFSVAGSDFSPRAIGRARVEAHERGMDLQLAVADMRDLSPVNGANFDAVICMDNALPHLESNEEVIQAAIQIREKLRPGGFLIASIQDYDRLIKGRPVVHGPSFHSDQEHRRIVFQVWDWIQDRQYVFHLYITRETATGWQTVHAAAVYRAILRDELTATLQRVGFKNVRWLSPVESGFYQPIVLAEADGNGSTAA
jgi:glycine/sarcosine N-methyltransferase